MKKFKRERQRKRTEQRRRLDAAYRALASLASPSAPLDMLHDSGGAAAERWSKSFLKQWHSCAHAHHAKTSTY